MERIRQFVQKNPSGPQMLVFVSTVLVLFFIIVFQSLTLVQSRYHIGGLEEDLFEAQNENKYLVEQIETKSTEAYVEGIAREKLGMVRSDEISVQVNEVSVDKKEVEKKVLDSNDKAGIYLKQWYEELNRWLDNAKN